MIVLSWTIGVLAFVFNLGWHLYLRSQDDTSWKCISAGLLLSVLPAFLTVGLLSEGHLAWALALAIASTVGTSWQITLYRRSASS